MADILLKDPGKTGKLEGGLPKSKSRNCRLTLSQNSSHNKTTRAETTIRRRISASLLLKYTRLTEPNGPSCARETMYTTVTPSCPTVPEKQNRKR